MNKLNCQVSDDEGLATIATNPEGTILIVGGSKGHVRIFDVKNLSLDNKKDFDTSCYLKFMWRAHIQCISSVNYVNTYDVILTASKDGTVRVWTADGTHIGIFGQDDPWIIGEPTTYMPLPQDVKHESALERQQNQMLNMHKEKLKKNVIETWRGISKDYGPEYEEGEDGRGKGFLFLL
ncbi:WD40 repeat domain 95 [Dinochytrium kinnereticum]|nr:WD40 repeat domain 95 [Dinochytrium kinnereticum]